MCVLSHAVTYMQAIAAARLFDEIPNSFAIRGHKAIRMRTPGAYPSPSEKSMPGTNCGVISGPSPMEGSKGRNEGRGIRSLALAMATGSQRASDLAPHACYEGE
jgi:hypothetical protein